MDTAASPDLFEAESRALQAARTAYDTCATSATSATNEPAPCRQALGDLLGAYERLLRETRRLIGRSDREELEMNRLNHRLQELAQELEYRATHDTLTGALNRGAVIDLATAALARGSLALIVLDIDHFKRLNDDFGHPVGDAVICGVTACLKDTICAEGAIGRVGGEEFAALLPDVALPDAMALAERMREAIASYRCAAPVDRTITASFGVSWSAQGRTFAHAYGRADEALYMAKRGGRNRVEQAAA